MTLGNWKAPPGYLNTASFGVPSEETVQEVTNTIQDWACGRLQFGQWLERAQAARASIARLLNVPVEWIALGSSSAPMLSSIAASIPDGALVLAPVNEHNSNLIPFVNQGRRGVTVRCVPLSDLASEIVAGVSVVSCSAVQSLTGEVADLEAIRSAARAAGSLFCLDISQACGWLPLDGSAADVIVCSVYKWLCSPIGGAFLVMSPEVAARFTPATPSWVALTNVLAAPYGTDLDLAKGARKFDTVPNLISLVGARKAIDLIADIGVPLINQHNVALANRFRSQVRLTTSNSAIVTMPWPGAAERLGKAGIRATEWRGNLRLSFHFYNSQQDVDRALNALHDAPQKRA